MLNIRIEGEIDTKISLQSDVHEMKEELATLRQILAVEADQTRKLKEEVRYLTPAFQYRTLASSYDSPIWYTSGSKLVELPELRI
jgi:FtsZ-binding cell division protein ZapB